MDTDVLFAMVSLLNLSIICHNGSDSKLDGWDITGRLINLGIAIWIIVRGFIK